VRLEFAFLCDGANQHGAKINALGLGWDTIYAASVPVTHPTFSLVAKLRASAAEAGEKDMAVHFIDADGRHVVPSITGKLAVPVPRTGTSSSINLVLALNGVRFEAYGDYSINLVVSGEERASLPLHVTPPPPASA
jgi:hypothetical protein